MATSLPWWSIAGEGEGGEGREGVERMGGMRGDGREEWQCDGVRR